VLEYRLYRDLQRGWRITAPNLEQCGLLEIRYLSLDEVCQAEDVWQNSHPALVTASSRTRMQVARVLLDYMWRELAIKVDVLSSLYQERIQRQSSQYLIDPWALDENEVTRMERAAILFPRPSRPGDYGGHVYLSARGGFGQYLGRNSTFLEWRELLRLEDRQTIILPRRTMPSAAVALGAADSQRWCSRTAPLAVHMTSISSSGQSEWWPVQ
jgi:hypothetical protein